MVFFVIKIGGIMFKEKIKIEQRIKQIRLYLINKLIGKDLAVISNIKITSDILLYNFKQGKEIELINVKVKTVSSNQSFVFNPTRTTVCS